MDTNAELISSSWTFWYKRIFPLFWFGILAIVFVGMLYSAFYCPPKSAVPLPVLIIPVFMAGFGYVLMKLLIFDLVDEVYDCGDSLLVKNETLEDRVLLSDIMNVSYSNLQNPPKVTLSIRRETKFGNEISFCPPIRFFTFLKSPVIKDLIVRVDSARRATGR